jgi:hypothetical protein
MSKATIRAQLKGLHSPDIPSLEDFRPDGPFGILVQAMVGPAGLKGGESFDIIVCTPDWFVANVKEAPALGRHHLFVENFNYQVLNDFLQKYCASCEGASWKDVAEKVGRIGKWEFEDYTPYVAPSSKH